MAAFGGEKLFQIPRSTSNLLKPDIEKFLGYSKEFYDAEMYTNGGPVSLKLEKRLAEFHEVEHCLVFSTGFWAIALAMRSLAIEGRDEVIMPSLTYRRMADIASWIPLKPHYCEVDPTTLAMSGATVEPCINDNTAIILGTHPIVNCAKSQELEALGTSYDIPVLFDSVESVFENVEGARIGGFGAAECFSLHACKLLNGFGGGYLTTNDDALAAQLKGMRNFGLSGPDGQVLTGGLNAKLNEIHAAMALASLDDLDDQISLNKERYITYRTLLSEIDGIDVLPFDEDNRSGFKNIVIKIFKPWQISAQDTINLLNAENVLARAYYAPPLHLRSAHIPHEKADLSQSEMLAHQLINLPCGQRVSTGDIEQIVQLLQFIGENSDVIAERGVIKI